MAAAQRVYEEADNVDDTLLSQISHNVFYNNLWILARDLEVPQTEIQRIAEIKDPQDKTFKVLHTWINKKFDFKVKDLVKEMRVWQQQGYLDRKIWHSSLFSPSLLPKHSSASSETEHRTHVSPTTLTISDQEREAFENEHLDPDIWVSKLCQHFNIKALKFLKEVRKDKIKDFLDDTKNTTTQCALWSLLRELKCLYVPPVEIECLTDLPDIIDRRRKYLTLNRDEDDETKFDEIVDQLESTIWKWHRPSSQSYEYLTCLATLNLFDFSLDELSFKHKLQENDVEKLSSVLRDNFGELRSFEEAENKQAFIMNIALNNPFDGTKMLHYIFESLKDQICTKFLPSSPDQFDHKNLYKTVNHILIGQTGEKALKEKQKSLSMYFNSIFSRKIRASQITEEHIEVNESVRNLLEDLGLIEYYPQKLSYSDVIKLTDDVFKDVNEKPSTLPELPWYFMRRLIELNSSIRGNGSIARRKSKCESRIDNEDSEEEVISSDEDIFSLWDEDSEEENKSEESNCQYSDESKMADVTCSVHPLDLIYSIFLCADDFLRQELADKMSKCQYAVPFILPSAAEKGEQSMSTVLHWGLQTISRTYYEGTNKVMTKTLPNVSCPLVSCLSFNTDTTWKYELLNKILNPQQDTFWHEGLEGGDRTQKVSQGMVEVSWYLPGGRGHDDFKTPVAFANLRGDAHHYQLVTNNLIKLSTTTCIFTDNINNEVIAFLGKYIGRKYLRRIILVVLHTPAKEKKHTKDAEKLKQQMHLDEYQVIHCSLQKSNFHTTYEILKKSLQTSIKRNGTRQISLSEFVEEVKSSNCMKVDDAACSDGYKAAQRILSDIENIEKSKILPCQSDVATREEISKHDKEICRHKEIADSVLMTQHVKREEDEKWKLQWKQLQYPISNTFTHFLRYITNFNSQNRKYFLQSLKLGLNERSTDLLQPLYEEYENCRLKDKCKKNKDETQTTKPTVDTQFTWIGTFLT